MVPESGLSYADCCWFFYLLRIWFNFFFYFCFLFDLSVTSSLDYSKLNIFHSMSWTSYHVSATALLWMSLLLIYCAPQGFPANNNFLRQAWGKMVNQNFLSYKTACHFNYQWNFGHYIFIKTELVEWVWELTGLIKSNGNNHRRCYSPCM